MNLQSKCGQCCIWELSLLLYSLFPLFCITLPIALLTPHVSGPPCQRVVAFQPQTRTPELLLFSACRQACLQSIYMFSPIQLRDLQFLARLWSCVPAPDATLPHLYSHTESQCLLVVCALLEYIEFRCESSHLVFCF